uniref:SEC7 domain-containing protein n=2 Tax=Parascaris univalens TaxID=6257 RepID=A0A915C108_PARUN
MAVNGLYIVQGESNSVAALLKKAHRGWSHHQQPVHLGSLDETDPLLRNFTDLRDVLNSVNDLCDMNPDTFLSPFLDVIRSEQTNGPVTAQALSSVAKFLSYGLIDSTSIKASNAVENIADAVTHAKFVGSSDSSSDEVVLLKILQVLRTLLLTPVGRLLSNESVCEMMQSCFRICFEGALSELLRRAAEATLADMTQLLFTRLPSFKEDIRHPYIRKLVKRTGGLNGKRKRRKAPPSSIKDTRASDAEVSLGAEGNIGKEQHVDEKTPLVPQEGSPILRRNEDEIKEVCVPEASATAESPHHNSMDSSEGKFSERPCLPLGDTSSEIGGFDVVTSVPCSNTTSLEPSMREQKTAVEMREETPKMVISNEELDDGIVPVVVSNEELDDGIVPDNDDSTASEDGNDSGACVTHPQRQRINDRGVRFIPESEKEERAALRRETESPEAITVKPVSHIPYGLPCARELLRFLIALTNPSDRANTESMILMGLNLLTVALEAGADYLHNYMLLMPLVKNELCRALLQLLDTEKLPVFAATNRVCFLLFEALRTSLKFQMESYFNKLKSIVTSEQSRISYEQKEMALESIVELWRIPGLVTELYLNYDCDLYCSNLFEDLTKLLLENAFPVMGLRSTHILSLDALLTVIDTIDVNCVYRQAGGAQTRISPNSSSTQLRLPVISGFSFGKQIEHSDRLREDSGGVNTAGKIASATKVSEVDDETCALLESLLPASAVRANRMAPSKKLPSIGEVIERKKQKRIITEGTDLFNQDPKKGVEFLKEKGILKTPLDPVDVVAWLRENPRLDKKRIADYICSRKNLAVLDAFVRSFPFENTRLDDALRMFLETFRLPGEAAEISMVMQHFADHWYKANGEPFNHVDAAFTLAYAVIMLNTDQHNPQVRRNQPPMQVECFKRNLSGTNGGQDFDGDMLEQMFHAIRTEEIVMPAEQVGLVKENYLWKVLLRRGETKEGEFIHVPAGWNDHDLFGIIWGPATAALSFVFDKSDQESILQKSLNGYRKCASIAAHYGMSDVFDNLIIHLCKFSTLMTSAEGCAEQNLELQRAGGLTEMTAQNAEQVAIAFGENIKAQMAAKAMFQLVHTHGDILREGWKNVLDCLLHLFRVRLLPNTLTEVEDFVDSKGWVSIQRIHTPKITSNRNDSGLLSWFGLGGSSYDTRETKPTSDQQQLIKVAQSVISDCHPEQLVVDGKYLTSSALTELINALVQASSNIVAQSEAIKRGQPTGKISEQGEDALVLYLELMVSITLENKDRLSQIWPSVQHHLQWIMSTFGRNPLLVERAVVGLLRLTNRNLFRLMDDVAEEILHSLGMLLKLRPPALFMFSRQIAFGLHELLRTNAANVHRREHWAVLFALLEAVGAGAYPEDTQAQRDQPYEQQLSSRSGERHAHSDTEPFKTRSPSTATSGIAPTLGDDRGYTSDDPQRHHGSISSLSTLSERADSAVSLAKDSTEWIHLDHKDAAIALQQQQMQLRQEGASFPPSRVFDRGTVVLRANLARHEPAAFLKVGETLAFLVRDAAHVTPENFDSCVHCLRAYVEASLDGGRYAAGPLSGDAQNQLHSVLDDKSKRPPKGGKSRRQMSLSSSLNGDEDADGAFESEQQQLSASYHQIAFQMLDLCHTLHVKAAGIYRSWAEGGAEVDASASALWAHCWRPLVQCVARLCCDCRRQVRTQALNYLVRSFLIADMQTMGASDWENCFGEVLFPLVQKLLENLSPMDPIGMEETRVRAMQLISKILLNHLTPLSTLPSFPALWLRLLDYMDRYLHTDRSDLLSEAIPESLKNMILVLDNTGMFRAIPGLYQMTVTRMGSLLPDLIAEVMPGPPERGSLEATPTLLSEQNIYQESFLASVTESAVVPTTQPTTVSLPSVAVSPSQAPPLSISTAVSTATPLTTSATPPVTQFASVLGGRVQIAPPLEVLAERQADSIKNDVSLRSESSNAPEVTERQLELLSTPSRNIEIPELEEVIVQSGSGSPAHPHGFYGVVHQGASSSALHQAEDRLSFRGTQHVQAPPHLASNHQTVSAQNVYADPRYPAFSQGTSAPLANAAALKHSPEYAYAGHLYQSAPPHLVQSQQFFVHTATHLSTTSLSGTQCTTTHSVGSPVRTFCVVPSPNSAFSAPLPSEPLPHSSNDTQHSDVQPSSRVLDDSGQPSGFMVDEQLSTMQQPRFINERP